MNLFKKVSLVILFSFLFVNNGCKEEKCGCEGEVLFTITKSPGILSYNEDTKFSSIASTQIYGSYFTICDPIEVWDMVSQFEDGADVLVWGRAADDCAKKTNPMYQNFYTLHLDSITIDEFMK